MHGSAQPDDTFRSVDPDEVMARTNQSTGTGGIAARAASSLSGRTLAETELDAALQLLVERAQYITGATGTALALPQGEEMVCRASAGGSAPAVGARLQVRSGLTGESISRRQLLRCDNAEADPRVNLEACRALGIASIVVLPLMRRNGEVRGLFELFSDHPYAFEERDLIALERMAALTMTALDLAEQRQNSTPAPALIRERETARDTASTATQPLHPETLVQSAEVAGTASVSDVAKAGEAAVEAAAPNQSPIEAVPAAQVEVIAAQPTSGTVNDLPSTSVPEAMLRVQKCSFCGFPVSEGRTLCLDCEKKDIDKKELEKSRRLQAATQAGSSTVSPITPGAEQDAGAQSSASLSSPESAEFLPAFLANAKPVKESWLSNPVNILAIAVLIAAILVAIVVFR